MDVAPSCYHWRTLAGAEVDLILEKNGALYSIEMKCKTNVTKADLIGIKAFKETYGKHQHIMPALVIYAGSEVFSLDENTLTIPWTLL